MKAELLSLLLCVQNFKRSPFEYRADKTVYVCYAHVPVARSPGNWIFSVAPNICHLSASYLLLVPFLAHRISRWLPGC